MRTIAVVVGLIVLMVAWWLVATRRRQLWHVIPLVMAALGIIAILLMPAADPQVSDGTALAVGAVSGIAMFLATRLFVGLAVLWKPFARHVEAAYREAAEEPFVRSLILSLLVSVPCEELFWRGLAQRTLAETWIGAGGAFVAVWLLYVVGNAPSRSLPIIAGAIVGGALWGALAWWSGGLIAPLASHVLWTGLMLVLPPAIGKRTSVVAPGGSETQERGVGRP
ncbi:MAG: CPBP family glutamic-type intramembrane protease [Actinomycetota bacterium]